MKDLFSANEHIYIQLAEILRSQIKNGNLEGKIPGVRDLADQYSVNFKTANKAVSLLVDEGYLHRLRGKGTFVKDGNKAQNIHATVGFIVTDIINPYFAHLAQALQEIAPEYSMTILVNTTQGQGDTLEKILNIYQQHEIHLIVVQGGVVRNPSHLDTILAQSIPLVGLHTHIDTIDDVWPDMHAGAQLITNHLVEQFGTKVGYISGSDEPVRQTGRFKGYRDALLSKGATIDNHIITRVAPTYRGGHKAVISMIEADQLPRAILFYNQIMAMGGASALISHKLRIPGDVAIASIDNSIENSQMLVTTTTIDHPVEETARQTLYLCRRRLTDPLAAPMHIRIAPHLILRESTKTNTAS